MSGGFSNLDGFNEETKTFWSTITPEIVEKSWGGWHLEYQRLYPENDWKTLIHDVRDMVNNEIYISEDKLKSITSIVLLAYGDMMYLLSNILFTSTKRFLILSS